MRVIRKPEEAHKCIVSFKQKGRRLGFVPTMGCLHKGHLALIRKARQENDLVVISIFVNPTQFGPREDYKSYPRDFRRDSALAKKAGVDIIFYPQAKDMYAGNHCTSVDVEGLTENLCGRFRPGHFRGVATIVTKLFNIIPADISYFGQKDAQQAVIIKRAARDLNIPIGVKIVPTVREKDGLAVSSRNIYLTKKERKEAPVLFKALLLAKHLIEKGESDSSRIISRMKDMIQKQSSAKVQYASIVDAEGLKDVNRIKGKVMIALAAYFGRTRLIDNIIVDGKGR